VGTDGKHGHDRYDGGNDDGRRHADEDPDPPLPGALLPLDLRQLPLDPAVLPGLLRHRNPLVRRLISGI
jgi:hypothetical protein